VVCVGVVSRDGLVGWYLLLVCLFVCRLMLEAVGLSVICFVLLLKLRVFPSFAFGSSQGTYAPLSLPPSLSTSHQAGQARLELKYLLSSSQIQESHHPRHSHHGERGRFGCECIWREGREGGREGGWDG